jgi:mannose-6-phosphate isomerase-like protein (cupin superfamily)
MRERFERRNNAKAQTWKKQFGSFGNRTWLHGNELWLRSCRRQAGDDLGHPGKAMRTQHPSIRPSPGVVGPLHSHDEPEVFYVLEGSLEVYREGDQSQGWSATQPGGVLAIPGKVKHALRNTSSTPTTVILVTQEELYHFFRSVAKPFEAGQMPAPPSPDDMLQLFAAAAKYRYWMGSSEENATISISLGWTTSPNRRVLGRGLCIATSYAGGTSTGGLSV